VIEVAKETFSAAMDRLASTIFETVEKIKKDSTPMTEFEADQIVPRLNDHVYVVPLIMTHTENMTHTQIMTHCYLVKQ